MKGLTFFSALAIILFAGCTKEINNDTSFTETAQLPGQLSVLFDITQDNSGMVTITPNGEGAVYYDVVFGDGTTKSARVAAGTSTSHVYNEGQYNVQIKAYNVSGKTTEKTFPLTVSFRAPENLDVTVDFDPADKYKVNVTAKANYETLFKVYFGDVVNEIPVSFNEGQTVSHKYAAVGTYNVKVVALSGGAATTEVIKTISIVDPVLLPVTFESPTIVYNFSNFDGGVSTVVDNPLKSGINLSNRAGKMVKNAGQVWGGSILTLGSPIDFSVNKIFLMKVLSPRAGAKVLLKVENISDASTSFEKEVTITKANAWEELAFDFRSINTSKSYQKIVLIFDLGTQGDGSGNFTFHFDDIRQSNVIPTFTPINLPVTFDDPNVDYTVTDFGNNQTADAVDPLNATNRVKRTTKPSGAETWAGTTIGTPQGFSAAIPVKAGAAQMSMRVYAPAAGIKVRLKIEDRADAAKSVETEATTTVANQWETLVFDFANQVSGTPALNAASSYHKASVFFDFGVAGSGKVFFWDDVKYVMPVVTPDVLGIPLTFESATINYAFTDFDGGLCTVINNPVKSGINTSNKVARMVKNNGQVWGGSYITLPAPIDFSSRKTFKMKVFGPRSGVKVLLKVENLNNGGISFEKEVTTKTFAQWEELTFDFSAINTANTYQKVVVIFDLGTKGDGTANFTYMFDDISLN